MISHDVIIRLEKEELHAHHWHTRCWTRKQETIIYVGAHPLPSCAQCDEPKKCSWPGCYISGLTVRSPFKGISDEDL